MTGLSNENTGVDAGHSGSTPDPRNDGGDSRRGNELSGRAVDAGGLDSRVTPIPSSIVQALCQIMVTVDAVKKSQKNMHGNYMFASTDDIYAAVTRKMGEVGVMMITLEDRCEIKRVEKDGKTAQWAHMEFSFVLATTRDTWSDSRAKRTLYIQLTGAQTFQAAQSYAEKSFLRSLFKLPTGDHDLDSMPQADNEDDQVESARPKGKRASSYGAKRDGVSIDAFNGLQRSISEAPNRDALQQVYMENCDQNGPWAGMPSKWAGLLQDDFNVKMEGFAAIQAAE